MSINDYKNHKEYKETGKQIVPTDCFTLICFKDSRIKENWNASYGNFDRFIPVIKSNGKYFEINYLKEVDIRNGVLTKSGFATLSHVGYDISNLVFFSLNDATLKPYFDENDKYYFCFHKEPFKTPNLYTSNSFFTSNYKDLLDGFVKIQAVRDIHSLYEKQHKTYYKQRIKSSEQLLKKKQAQEFIESLGKHWLKQAEEKSLRDSMDNCANIYVPVDSLAIATFIQKGKDRNLNDPFVFYNCWGNQNRFDKFVPLIKKDEKYLDINTFSEVEFNENGITTNGLCTLEKAGYNLRTYDFSGLSDAKLKYEDHERWGPYYELDNHITYHLGVFKKDLPEKYLKEEINLLILREICDGIDARFRKSYKENIETKKTTEPEKIKNLENRLKHYGNSLDDNHTM